ncbi:right-handed parallel beta-helix repeat-containing protein [Pontiella agarivorans]|uniref:Right-handed parallel beta-helix repeat-containing protein n=1 Tax=Pontiella agarivorans TaxID=3038953 RepID=A0ABU5MY94_9BACT|nr:right-handed parallel beta-helix repeat-containing protein [Pontiella agarivorans]MDZ8119143.1 right-handed parallel beta-helix repeat-containing protein [Pontiella agarivorans]
MQKNKKQFGVKSLLVGLLTVVGPAGAMEYHVALNGNDSGPGTESKPMRTIQAAANLAMPGDIITVHEGTYRERIDPPRGGTSDEQRIVYQAAQGENVTITGAEEAKGWVRQSGDVWLLYLPNDYFGAYNPFFIPLEGDWFFPLKQDHKVGAVYFNDNELNEAAALEDLYGTCHGKKWYSKSDNQGTWIWANFTGMPSGGNIDPNTSNVEISKRRAVFYPSKPNINYITVRGFKLTKAANPWSPPTTEQIGLIGTGWSKGWIIEDNEITRARCTGLTLGKNFDRFDGLMDYGYNAHYQLVERTIARGDWNKDNVGGHLVRNNRIAYCGQSGIVGSHGAAFSTITGNVIHDIFMNKSFEGFEQAGIKFHAPVDTLISNNLIYNSGCKGIWLDWMSQGARVTGNILYNHKQMDLFVEVNHGPLLVDNNIMLSDESLRDASQGSAFVHNLFGGKVIQRPEHERLTQFFKPHSTELVGRSKIFDGDDRFYNNIVMEDSGLRSYNNCKNKIQMGGNLFLYKAVPANKLEKNAQIDHEADTRYRIRNNGGKVFLELDLNADWAKGQKRDLVTTKMLGKTEITHQAFEHADGTPVSIDTDFFGAQRNVENPFPGPVELSGSVERIQIWPAQK